MVTSEDLVLDEVILQVFEESNETFHFPVTSQKDARAFVKALHKKGLSYDSLSHEIKEAEQNFSAWRTGISRPGIGNRVLERINRPLQDVLLSDGEDNYASCDQLSMCSDDTGECDEANYNGGISFPVPAELKYAGTDRSGQKLDGKELDKKSGDSSKLNGSKRSDENLEQVPGEKGQGDRITRKNDKQAKETSSVVANGSDIAIKKNAEVVNKQNDLASIGHDSSVVRPSETKPGQDLKPAKAKKPDIGKAVKKTGDTEKTVEHEELKECGMKNAECDLTNVAVQSFDSIHCKDAVSHDKTLSEDSALPPENYPNVLTEAENEELLERQEPSSAEERLESAKETQSLQLLKGIDGEKNSTSKNPEDLLNKSEVRDDIEDTVQTDVNAKTDATFVSPKCSVDILENYNSDLDDELIDDDDIADVTEIENEIVKETTKESDARDFGYIYVFTDTASDVDEFRVKVGASRFPHKRLKQARLFNIDMKLVSAVKVSRRQEALDAVRQHLNEYAMPNTTGWFRGPLDKILNILMSATKNHPAQD